MSANSSPEQGGMTRREMLRASLVAAAWSVPAVMAVSSTPASAAGSPAPQGQAPGSPAPDGRGRRDAPEDGLLPRTGGSIGWLAIAAAGAMGTGSAALKRARTLRSRASLADTAVGLDVDGEVPGQSDGGSDDVTGGAAEDAVAEGDEGDAPYSGR